MTTSHKIIFYGGGAWGQALAIALSNCNAKSSILVSDKFKILAPKIVGIEIKKENFAASTLEYPKYLAAEIVTPDLEDPGISAATWAKPIIIACW